METTMAREEIAAVSQSSRGHASREIHSDDIKIEQRPAVDPANYDGDVILADRVIDTDYADELAFMEEPVTIRLEPSAERNAVAVFPVWVNGKGAEILLNGRWSEVGWLPTGRVITVKRKVLEVIVRTKIDTVRTEIREPESEHPHNKIERFTSAVHSFSILEDRNPKGIAWMTELRRRNM
jgi:hypothetical protein